VFKLKSITVKFALAAMIMVGSISAAPAWAQNRREGPHPKNEGRAQNQGHPQGGQGHVGEWLRQHRNLPPEQQKKALENDSRFRGLPPQKQEALRNQLQRFNSMPPQQQERMLNRMETWEHLTPDQKQQARQLHDQMQQLPPERRQAIRNAVEALRAMPPDARQKAIESDAYKGRFNPQEREMLGNASRLPLAPAEPNEQAPIEQGPEP